MSPAASFLFPSREDLQIMSAWKILVLRPPSCKTSVAAALEICCGKDTLATGHTDSGRFVTAAGLARKSEAGRCDRCFAESRIGGSRNCSAAGRTEEHRPKPDAPHGVGPRWPMDGATEPVYPSIAEWRWRLQVWCCDGR